MTVVCFVLVRKIDAADAGKERKDYRCRLLKRWSGRHKGTLKVSTATAGRIVSQQSIIVGSGMLLGLRGHGFDL